MILASLKKSGGNSGAARALGITERIMGLRVKKYGIDYKKLRTTDASPSNAGRQAR
jgi:Nif-specific regulatory protein